MAKGGGLGEGLGNALTFIGDALIPQTMNQFRAVNAQQRQQAQLLGQNLAGGALLSGIGKQLPARAGAINSGMTIGADGMPSFNMTQAPAMPARPVLSPQMTQSLGRSALGEGAYNALQSRQVAATLFPAGPSKDDYIDTDNGTFDVRTRRMVPGTATPVKPEGLPGDAQLALWMTGGNVGKAQSMVQGWKSPKTDQPKGLIDQFERTFGKLSPGFSPVVNDQGVLTGEQKPAPGGAADPSVIAKQKEAEARAKIEQERPDAEKNVNMLIGSLDNIEKTAREIRTAPNLSSVTGPIQGRTMSFGPKNANLDAKIKSLQAQLSVNSLQNMKATGLSTGTITESEWPRFESLVTSLDQVQDETQYASAMTEIESFVKKLKGDVQSNFQKKYSPADTSQGGWSISKVN